MWRCLLLTLMILVVQFSLVHSGRNLDIVETLTLEQATSAANQGNACLEQGLAFDAAAAESNSLGPAKVQTELRAAAAKAYKEAARWYRKAIESYEKIQYFEASSRLYDSVENAYVLAAQAYQGVAENVKAGFVYRMLSSFYRSIFEHDKASVAIIRAANAFRAGGDYLHAGFAYISADQFTDAWAMQLELAKEKRTP